MAILGRVWYEGAESFGFKSLLRTGTFPNFSYWVGGDRATPFGPLPTVGDTFPTSIMATGPGLDDWVVCYHRPGRLTVTFVGPSGVIGTGVIDDSADFIDHTSKGNFASIRYGNFGGTFMSWATPSAMATAPIAVAFSDVANFVLPDAFVLEYGDFLEETLSPRTAIDPTLSHAVHQFGGTQTLWAGSTPTTITPTIAAFDPGAGMSALINKVLHLIPSATIDPTPFTTEPGGNVECEISRWQLFDDGTWAALESIQGTYQGQSSDYRRIDYSYYAITT